MDDLEFIQRCVKGDKQSWNDFIDKYSRLIYNYIYSVLKTKGSALTQENINDLFQEIYLSLIKDNFKKLSSFKAKNGCSLASWLRQVTINFTIDYIRRLKPAVSIDEEINDDFTLAEMLSSNLPSARDKISAQDQLADLKDCVNKLDNDEKYFLELHFNEDIGLNALKAHFKISRGAIDMRKSRIVERLRECFKEKGFIF